MFYSYFSHAARDVTRQMHLASYYFQPSGEESVGSFVLRNLRNTFNVFSPVSLENEIIVLSLSLVLLTAAFACVIGFRSKEGYVLATVPLIFLVTIAGSLIAASILGLYPFGGGGQAPICPVPVYCSQRRRRSRSTALLDGAVNGQVCDPRDRGSGYSCEFNRSALDDPPMEEPAVVFEGNESLPAKHSCGRRLSR